MRKEVKFQAEDFIPDWLSGYSEKKFTVFNTCFLSTKKNSHELDISEEVLKRDAQSILGNFLVAKLQYGDATTHLSDEIMYGYFPKDQEIVFEESEENGEKIVKAKAYCVISKMYGKDFNDIFSYNNLRNTSVEMTVEVDEEDENKVLGFDIYGLTCLGMAVNGSCPDANMKMVRFSEEDADKFFAKVHNGKLTALKKFVEDRKKSMEESKTYKIDKTKEAMSDKAWGNVDKTKLRNKVMSAKNKSTLVKAVYMLVEDGWEEAPSKHLKYPVMELKGDTFVYNKGGLSSALGDARKENETAVVNKIEKIYKNLGLDQDGKEDTKMSEIGFEEKIENKEEMAENEQEMECKKMEEDCGCEDNKDDDKEEVEMSADEMKAEMAKMKSEIEERDNIIMEKDKKMADMEKELSELREFKKTCMEKEKAASVDAVMNEVKEYMEDEQFKNLRDEGLACEFSQIDAWSNKVKAFCFEKGRKTTKTNSTIMAFSANFDYSNKKKPNSVWETL